ncbi:MAG: hypothetical protein HY459_04320 [Parcubacteria group bacterium]|nr:hypothetical protein [Parcubacteria group bacterium]
MRRRLFPLSYLTYFFLLLTLGAVVYIFVTLFPERRAVIAEITRLKESTALLGRELSQKIKLEEDLKHVSEKSARIFLALPRQPGFIDLALQLEAIGAASGVQFENFTLDKDVVPVGQSELTAATGGQSLFTFSPVEQEVLKMYEFTLSFNGSLATLKAFLTNAAKSLRLIDVVSLTFDDQSAVSGLPAGFHQYQLIARAYVIDEGELSPFVAPAPASVPVAPPLNESPPVSP